MRFERLTGSLCSMLDIITAECNGDKSVFTLESYHLDRQYKNDTTIPKGKQTHPPKSYSSKKPKQW